MTVTTNFNFVWFKKNTKYFIKSYFITVLSFTSAVKGYYWIYVTLEIVNYASSTGYNFIHRYPGRGFRGMNFDPVKYVKETFSRVGYACDMNYYPFTRCLKMKFDPISNFWKDELCSNFVWLHRKLKVDQSLSWTRDQGTIRKYAIRRKWIKVHLTCISNTGSKFIHLGTT